MTGNEVHNSDKKYTQTQRHRDTIFCIQMGIYLFSISCIHSRKQDISKRNIADQNYYAETYQLDFQG